jgi:chromate transport protein ChrA
MPGPDWRGITAATLAFVVGAVLIIGAIFAGLNDYRAVTSEEVATVSTVLGAAIGAIATYLGTRHRPPPGPPGQPPGRLDAGSAPDERE